LNNLTIMKVLFVVLGVLIVISGVLFYFSFSRYHEIKTDPSRVFQGSYASPTASQTSEIKPSGKIITVDGRHYKEKPNMLNILFLGIDANTERTKNNKGYHSDMIMICAVDMLYNRATLISIPRDTYTRISLVDENTGAVKETIMNKINAAYAFGHGKDKYSYQNAIRAVEDFMNILDGFDLNIRYYAGIDVEGIPKVASALGGVSVKLTEDFPKIGKAGNTVTLRGKKAVDFVREKKKLGGDIGRIQRQQLFMAGIAKKIQKMGAMQAAPRLFEKLSAITSTNFTLDEVVGLAMILDKIEINAIRHVTISGESAIRDKQSCFIADVDSIREIILSTYFDPLN